MDVGGKHALVMGLGRFGGGVGAARYLACGGARVIVTDLAGPDELADSIAQLAPMPIEGLHLGGHRPEDFIWADIVVVNPAIPLDHPLLALAQSHGARCTTEINLFVQSCPAPIIGVTGSNGKSTTAGLIATILGAAGWPAWLGGNIGCSLLEKLDEIRPDDWVVLELSSFQLEGLDRLRRSPHVAVVTNFTPNHLDRHRMLAAYRWAKQTILRYQCAGDLMVLNADDPEVSSWRTCGRKFYFGTHDHGYDGVCLKEGSATMRRKGREITFELLDALRLPGRHNISNALGAACCAWSLGVDPDCIARGLAQFQPLRHHLELVVEVGGRRFFDDSKATTPEATSAALEALSGPIWLIAGGADKGLDLTELARSITARVQGVVLLGEVGTKLGRNLARCVGIEQRPLITYAQDMGKAVAWCYSHSEPGDLILLSPACASFGMFPNYVERGRAFRQAITGLPCAA